MKTRQRLHNSLLIVFLMLIAVTLMVSTATAKNVAVDEGTLIAEPVTVYIVQGQDMDSVTAAVRAVGGTITHELGVINAVGAELTAAQRESLSQNAGISRITIHFDLGP